MVVRTAGFGPGVSGVICRQGRRHLKCRLEYGGTGANADVNVRALGGKCFIGASFRFCLPGSGRAVRDAAQRDATAQIKSQPPSFNRPLIYWSLIYLARLAAAALIAREANLTNFNRTRESCCRWLLRAALSRVMNFNGRGLSSFYKCACRKSFGSAPS